MPQEPSRWLLKEYIRAQLEAIDVDAYWNRAARVLHGHPQMETLQGDLDSATFSYEIEDGVTNEEEQLPDLDRAITTLSIRGFKKTSWVLEKNKNELDHEAERLLQDTGRAALQNPGMQCNASRAYVVSQGITIYEGSPGWVGSQLVLQIYHDQGYVGP